VGSNPLFSLLKTIQLWWMPRNIVASLACFVFMRARLLGIVISEKTDTITIAHSATTRSSRIVNARRLDSGMTAPRLRHA
jgi:hypothetical protein